MPWITNPDYDVKEYTASLWSKDELPTWGEIWEWWNSSDRGDVYTESGERDRYWNIDPKLYIIGMMCNQFNKMLLEDRYYDAAVKDLDFLSDVLSIEFVIVEVEDGESIVPINGDGKHTIYSFNKLMNSQSVLYRESDDVYRVMLEDIDSKKLRMVMIYSKKDSSGNRMEYIAPRLGEMDKVIDYLMQPIIKYFTETKFINDTGSMERSAQPEDKCKYFI